jgi:hypothetical protein
VSRRASSPTRRTIAAGAILAMWLVGLGMLAKRELFRPPLERLARAAMLVAPGATYFAVYDGDRHVGFASSTIDTTEKAIIITNYLVADLGEAGATRRTTATTAVRMSRGLRLLGFDSSIHDGNEQVEVGGEVESDSLLRLVVARGGVTDTGIVELGGPVLLPTILPLAAVLAGDPAVGRSIQFPVFDPSTRETSNVRLTVDAESLFVVHDSASYDTSAGRWRAELPDTLRAWHIKPTGEVGFTGWVDEQGHVLRTTALGRLVLVRAPFELAWENWRLGAPPGGGTGMATRNVTEMTPTAAGAQPGPVTRELRLRLTGAGLDQFAASTPRQHRRGDTLVVFHPYPADMRARYALPMRAFNVYREFLEGEPLIDVDEPTIVRLARTLAGGASDPRVAAERIHDWLRDSLEKRPVVGTPSAREVLAARAGDGGEHARLAVALSRAAGVPARLVEGLVRVDGRFHFHSWVEVRLGEWVGMDPALGRFPTDANYVRLTVGGRPTTAALLRLIGTAQVDVISETR